ncbi:MAG: Nramp family divalent metal transporter [Planctomycetes bacterium]|nr:Nramp family divalent metal transporter [Planctomycetota bacterium]
MAVEGSTNESNPETQALTEEPPTRLAGILRRLGPGLILAGGIVGSGELIATTKTGAEAGFWLLWLILIGCVIKVFVQIELGRYAIVGGKTTIDALSEVPGPRISGRGNWIVWYWLLMFVAVLGQSGGIVGGVGQALAMTVPLTDDARVYYRYVDAEAELKVKQAELRAEGERVQAGEGDASKLDSLTVEESKLRARLASFAEKPPEPYDDRIWATVITAVTALVLVFGRYGLIQSFATVMVIMFTIITVVNVIMLQTHADWAVKPDDIVRGFSFRLPPTDGGAVTTALATALATFGIIGVGATELVSYPYWCIEKGYARFTGARDDSEEWATRARGWMRVMRWDAWSSMALYTFATLAFYLLGAAVLGRSGLNPGGTEMIRTLAVMYEPVFGSVAQWLFLFGAFAVLYSTFFVGSAGHARVLSDVLRVVRITPQSERAYRKSVRVLSGVIPFVALTFYLFIQRPALLVLMSGLMQAIMLPMLAVAALYFRYRRSDPRVRPGRAWDTFLWISAAGMVVAGLWAAWEKLTS